MKVFAALAAIVGGVLLIVIPRFVFQTCEHLGRGRMHCTAAAHGEYFVGVLLALAGVVLFFATSNKAATAAAGCAIALCAAAFLVPVSTRYCANPDMACHYGMVPSVRFIAVAVGLAQGTALVGLARESMRGEG